MKIEVISFDGGVPSEPKILDLGIKEVLTIVEKDGQVSTGTEIEFTSPSGDSVTLPIAGATTAREDA
jgi:hypothetical protein